jgi:hypothetical protein
MKNLNVYEFNGNLEKAIKNGEINQLIFISGNNYGIQKFLKSLGDSKEILPTENFPFLQNLITYRTPFRIGPQQIRVIYIDDIIDKNNINIEQLKKSLENITRKYKYSVIGFPISGSASQFSEEIKNCIYSSTCYGKIAII